ncbi:MAG: hypothetical protein MR806_09225 [Subdoligranulum sp.]|nr:hypothetical protein [Subdoligranulum sp.]
MRVPQPDIIEHFGNADAVPQPPERCLSRQAGIVRYYLNMGVRPLYQTATASRVIGVPLWKQRR